MPFATPPPEGDPHGIELEALGLDYDPRHLGAALLVGHQAGVVISRRERNGGRRIALAAWRQCWLEDPAAFAPHAFAVSLVELNRHSAGQLLGEVADRGESDHLLRSPSVAWIVGPIQTRPSGSESTAL